MTTTTIHIECDHCHGVGEGEDIRGPWSCPECGGVGYVEVSRERVQQDGECLGALYGGHGAAVLAGWLADVGLTAYDVDGYGIVAAVDEARVMAHMPEGPSRLDFELFRECRAGERRCDGDAMCSTCRRESFAEGLAEHAWMAPLARQHNAARRAGLDDVAAGIRAVAGVAE